MLGDGKTDECAQMLLNIEGVQNWMGEFEGGTINTPLSIYFEI